MRDYGIRPLVVVSLAALLALGMSSCKRGGQASSRGVPVHIEYEWKGWAKDRLNADQIAEYMAIFKAAVEKDGMAVVDSQKTPTVKVTLDMVGGIIMPPGGGETETYVRYDLTFLYAGLDNKQVFKKVYTGQVKGGGKEIGSRVGVIIKHYDADAGDAKQPIIKQLESEPLDLRSQLTAQ